MGAKRVAVIVGRWQFPHRGHESLIQHALGIADSVVIVLGSALRARNPRQPFNWREVAAMLGVTLSPAQRKRVSFLPVRDYHDNARWIAAVRRGVDGLAAPGAAEVSLVRCKEEGTGACLEDVERWTSTEVDRELAIDATAVRNVYFGARDVDSALKVLEPMVSPPVLDYLQAWSLLPEYPMRVAEHRAVVAYREKWTAAAYNTADAVVRVGDHVLLVRRKGPFGEDLWANAGGHLESTERFLTGAIRELYEETNFPLAETTLHRALTGTALFDDPWRSPRGRLVTVAHYFRYDGMAGLPAVLGSDDVKEAKWFHVGDLAGMEELMFEDHFIMLDHFLGILQD